MEDVVRSVASYVALSRCSESEKKDKLSIDKILLQSISELDLAFSDPGDICPAQILKNIISTSNSMTPPISCRFKQTGTADSDKRTCVAFHVLIMAVSLSERLIVVTIIGLFSRMIHHVDHQAGFRHETLAAFLTRWSGDHRRSAKNNISNCIVERGSVFVCAVLLGEVYHTDYHPSIHPLNTHRSTKSIL